jgi:hypothetical protein
LVRSGSGRLGPDPDQDPDLDPGLNKWPYINFFMGCGGSVGRGCGGSVGRGCGGSVGGDVVAQLAKATG